MMVIFILCRFIYLITNFKSLMFKQFIILFLGILCFWLSIEHCSFNTDFACLIDFVLPRLVKWILLLMTSAFCMLWNVCIQSFLSIKIIHLMCMGTLLHFYRSTFTMQDYGQVICVVFSLIFLFF